MLRQLGIGQRVVQQLVDEEAVLVRGAAGSGSRVSRRGTAGTAAPAARLPGERTVRRRSALPRRAAACSARRVTPAEFEEDLRQAADHREAAGRGQAAWVRVTDAEVDEEYRRRNEKVKLDLAVFTANQFRAGIQPTDAEIEARFKANPETYRLPEKRRVRYLAVTSEALRRPDDGRRRRKSRPGTTRTARPTPTPEQVRASHILFKTGGQGRGGGEEAGRGRPRQGQGRRRLRRAGEAVLRGRPEQGRRRRPRLLRPRRDGAGVRRRGLGARGGQDERAS